MKHHYPFHSLYTVLFLFFASPLLAQPVISSFTPTSGHIGTTVTINGTGFSSTPTDNMVYFGAVKAAVSASAATSLTVTVPTGATYQPISVTTGGLTGYSGAAFVVTFPGAYPAFTDSSFNTKVDSSIAYPLVSLGFADFDGDGKIDIVSYEGTLSSSNSDISVYKNTSVPGKISLGTKLWYPGSAINPFPVVVCTDIDGDGRIDIVGSDRNNNRILIYLNTSSGGTISFNSPVNVPMSFITNVPFGLTTGDFNGDGKPELVLSNLYGDISMFINTSTPGNIAFTKTTFSAANPLGVTLVSTGDIDGDNKTDIVVALGSADKFTLNIRIFVLRNTSAAGTLSFGSPLMLADIPGSIFNGGLPNGFTNGLAVGDLDGDSKPDIAVTDSVANLAYIFKNTSSPGAPSLDAGISLPGGNSAVSITDIDGDGKPDLAVSGSTGISLFKNASTPGTISFAAKADYLAGYRTVANGMPDIDGDGKPDLVVANASTLKLSIFRNKIGEPLLGASGANPVTGDVIKTVTVDASVKQSNGIAYVQRHYDIEPVNNPATSTAHLKLYFTQADFDNFNAFPGHGADLPAGPSDNTGKANLRIYQNHGFSTTGTPGSYSGSTVVINPDDGNINWNAGTQLWEVDFDVTGFSGFFISSQASALPLKLLSFTATEQANNVLLKWTTTSEVNTSWFEVQRGTDGSQFAPVAGIKAAGNSSTVLNYQYVDTPGPRPVYYYRLKMTDIDGSSTYSDIVQITLASRRSPLRIYPNPARNYITVETPAAAKASLRLLDISGKLLQKTELPKNSVQTTLGIQGLAPGSYKIIWSDGTKTLTQSLLIL